MGDMFDGLFRNAAERGSIAERCTGSRDRETRIAAESARCVGV
jgi:hypothetical protein